MSLSNGRVIEKNNFLREKDNEMDERMSDFVFGGYVMLDNFRLG